MSIALVLFFTGLFLTMIIFGSTFVHYARESIVMQVFIHDGMRGEEMASFEEELSQRPYVKKLVYVSKEEAGKYLMNKTGEDVSEMMGGINPLPASFNITLYPEYINLDSLQYVRKEIETSSLVSEIDYPAEKIIMVNRNIRMLNFAFGTIGIILVGIAFYLIFGTIRLSIFAQRLTIRSMQLIGATNNFIRRPFLVNGLVQGGIAGIIASALLLLTLTIVGRWMSSMNIQGELFTHGQVIGLLAGIVLFGLGLGLSGSLLAVNKYLNRNLDELI